MPRDLSTLTTGQLEALAMVLEPAIRAGERAAAAGVVFTAFVDVDGEFATVAFSWPCDAPCKGGCEGGCQGACEVSGAAPAGEAV